MLVRGVARQDRGAPEGKGVSGHRAGGVAIRDRAVWMGGGPANPLIGA